MFNTIPQAILGRMNELEELDRRDREDGTPRLGRLRQIPPETGRFLALLAACAPPGRYIEIGTSAGYSAMWLALACRLAGGKLTTYEILETKAALARQTIELTGIGDVVELVHGDALAHLGSLDGISFCFLDAEKEVYSDCYDLVIPRLVPGGLLVADNAINHAETLAPVVNRALADGRVDAMVVPVGKGELLCRKL